MVASGDIRLPAFWPVAPFFQYARTLGFGAVRRVRSWVPKIPVPLSGRRCELDGFCDDLRLRTARGATYRWRVGRDHGFGRGDRCPDAARLDAREGPLRQATADGDVADRGHANDV